MTIYPIGTKNDDETRNIINNNFGFLRESSNELSKEINDVKKYIDNKGEEILSEAVVKEWLSKNEFKPKEAVATFNDLPRDAELKELRGVTDENAVYVYDGAKWVKQSNLNFDGLQQVKNQTIDQVNVKDFGAVGDGITDDTQAIQDAVNYAKVNKLSKVFINVSKALVSKAITCPGYMKIFGFGADKTTIEVATNTFNVFEIEQDARRTEIMEMSIINTKGYGTSNSAIYANDTNGGAEHHYKNLIINGFKYGIHVGAVWWCNTVENVRWNSCDFSFYGNAGAGGQSMNTLFVRCYTNKANTRGYEIIAFKNTTWLSCNFGGVENKASDFARLLTNSQGMKFVGCNFEHINLAQDTGGVSAWSGSEASFDGCTFNSNQGLNGARAYEIVARDNSTVRVVNCSKLNQGAAMYDFYSMNDAQLSYDNCPTMTKTLSYSSKPIIDISKVIKDSIETKALNVKVNASGTYQSGNVVSVGFQPSFVQVMIDPSYANLATTRAAVSEIAATYFKVRFYSTTNGTEIFNTSIPIKYVVY